MYIDKKNIKYLRNIFCNYYRLKIYKMYQNRGKLLKKYKIY